MGAPIRSEPCGQTRKSEDLCESSDLVSALEILKLLKIEGFSIDVYQNKTVTFSEQSFNTFLYQKACIAGGEWVLFLDADEFIDDRKVKSGLRSYLDLLAPDLSACCIKVPLVDYEATSNDNSSDLLVPRRIVCHGDVSSNYKVIVKKVANYCDVVVESGSHSATFGAHSGNVDVTQSELVYAHYSERSPYIWIRKFVKGWAKILASHPSIMSHGHSMHYRGPFDIMRQDPKQIVENGHLMGFKNERAGLKDDPINYRGADLKYTPVRNERNQAMGSLMTYLQELAQQHSYLLEHSPEAAAISKSNEQKIEKVL